MNKWHPPEPDEAAHRAQLSSALSEKLENLRSDQLGVLLAFVEQVVTCHDPDVVTDFLEWRRDPKLGSILQLAAALGDEMRDQLLFLAEELYTNELAGDETENVSA